MSEQTAMLLTDDEWQDLAVMVGIYIVTRKARLRSDDLGADGREAIERRCNLADRIREAVYGNGSQHSPAEASDPDNPRRPGSGFVGGPS